MECRNCGTQIAPTDHFCHVCGTPMDHPSSFFHQREGTVPTVVGRGKVFGINKVLLASGAFVLALGAGITFFAILPRVNALSFIKTTRQALAETSDKTAKVNQSLEAIYSYVTNSSSSTTVSTIELTANGGGGGEKAELSFLALKKAVNEATASAKNKNVKGFSTPDLDPLKGYRNLLELSQAAKRVSEDGLTSVNKFSSLVKENSTSARLAPVADSLDNVREDTQDYLNEAEKTAQYYLTYANSYVDLSSMIIESLQGSSQEKAKSNLTKAKAIAESLNKINEANLPVAMASFHQDILEEVNGAVDFLDSFTELTFGSDKNKIGKVTQAAENWLEKEKSLALRLQTDQVSFWKGNEALSGFEFLAGKQNDALDKLEVERKNNNLFLLSWVGIK
ncbi:MAG: zinc ribbon domain-containing protein [bacterium]|nr:zinc ribbon domain-containing protein [bacterium]